MRKINKKDVIRLVLVLSLVAGMGLAFGAIGRFVPTHMIEMPVYCGSCHPEQVQELGATTHLGKFADTINQTYAGIKNSHGVSVGNLEAGLAISGGCMLCHNYWDNMEWFGVRNFTVRPFDNTSDMLNGTGFTMPTDIYGNAVSPYGLASTTEYVMNATYDGSLGLGNSYPAMVTIPWAAGLDTYQYTDTNGVTYSRVDYVWSKLSSLSPGPVGFLKVNSTTGAVNTCGSGNAEHGMCHIGKDAVAESFASQRASVQEFPAVPQNGTQNISTMKFGGRMGAGDFFRHEMAFTTAQYAAVNVKICGACHVFKLPPMQWGGEPWAISDIKFASGNPNIIVGSSGYNDNPFGFRPTYNDLTGLVDPVLSHNGRANSSVMFRTPDFAHANVKCIRCHVHAGINGETVTDNVVNTLPISPGP